jgi:hypothetical protein
MLTMVAPLPQQFTLHESVDGRPSLGHSFSQKKKVIMSLVDGINKLIITTKLLLFLKRKKL